MRNTLHSSKLVGDQLEELGINILEASKALCVMRQQLHNVNAGRSAISPKMAYRLKKAIGSTPDTWLRVQVNYDNAQVRARASNIEVGKLVPQVA